MVLAAVMCIVAIRPTLGQESTAPKVDSTYVQSVIADTKWLSDFGTRQIGTPEHDKAQQELLAKVGAVPGVRVWTHEFPVLVPINDETYLDLPDGPLAGRQTLYPLWPDVGRLNTTPEAGFTGKLIYIGDASYPHIPAKGLRGNIAVMEMSAYEHYRRAFDFGAAAVILLESSEAGQPVPTNQSLYKPRYYVPAGALADALRSSQIASATLVSKGHWQTVTARNIYAAVKPADAKDAAPYALVVPYDSMSRVMGMAPGADTALDCAVALNELRRQAGAPDRPLIFAFVDAYHINQLGVRQMAAMFAVIPEGRTRKAYDKVEAEDLKDYQEAADQLAQLPTVEEGLKNLNNRSKFESLHRTFKDTLGIELLKLRELQGELRLASLRTKDENTLPVRRQMLSALVKTAEWMLTNVDQELTGDEKATLTAARAYALKEMPPVDADDIGASQWTGMDEARTWAQTLMPITDKPLGLRNHVLDAAFIGKDVTAQELAVARIAWDRMTVRVKGQLEEQKARIAFFEPMDALRNEIEAFFGFEATGQARPAVNFVVGVDLSDCGIVVGPGTMCGYNGIDPTDRDLVRELKRAYKRGDLWKENSPERKAVNISSVEGQVGGNGDNGHRALLTSPAASFLLPNMTWVTDDAPRQRVDSPLDRFENINWNRVVPQFAPTRTFLHWLFTTSDYTPKIKTVAESTAEWRHGMGRVVDVSAGETVPRVPRPGFLVTLVGGVVDEDGIRRQEFAWTGEDGSFRIPLLCGNVRNQGSYKNFNLAAYNLDKTGAITEALTTAESLVTTRLATSFNLTTPPGEQLPRAVTFECVELNGPSFFDARFLEPLTQASLIDAVRGGAPKQSNFTIDSKGQMWGLVKDDTRWQLVVRAGASGVRMALLNAPEDAKKKKLNLRQAFQRGYPVEQRLVSIPTYLSAKDIYELDGWRLADFRAAGISSKQIDKIRKGTAEYLEDARAALATDDGAALQRASVRAQASEIRAYRAVKDTGQDIARGAIFLMLMLVPFCVAMERLLFAFPKIGSQVMSALGIFAVMTLLLWSFHPAFRISAQPLVIVMSFTILGLSMLVIVMVLNRFRASVREFQSNLAEGSGAQMGRGGLLGSAVFLGIANMRKRKVRTALTGTTIMLVTFALLCFSSASSYIDNKEFRIEGVQAQKPSVLIRRPTFGPIDWSAVDGINNLLEEHPVATGSRSWLGAGLGDANWRLWAINPATGGQVAVRGALGLPPIEDQLTGVDKVLPNWDKFSKDGGCYLPKYTADQLGVKVGDTVVIRGYELVLRGVFDPLDLEDKVALLDGQRILPYDYSRQEQDWVNRDSQDAIEQETESAGAMQPSSADMDRYLSAREVVLLPTEMLKDLGGTLRSIGMACGTTDEAAGVARSLMQTIVYPVYYANKDGGVNVVVSTPLVAVPPKNLAVPLVIASLIIFTTMLNSVSERKKEIYVYSSLGLAPVHIGALFVAEALTYGLMGAVFGYVAGQATATLLTHVGWMQGVTLNYSGTSVIKTMFLVQVMVVFAAFVPAIVAGRIASPSTEMDWKVPDPVDGVIHDTLPFTVHPAAAPGLIAFIHEYLEAHRDGVLGHFDVDAVQLLKPGEGGCVAGLDARVWLAPFDMGVRQSMRLTIEQPDDGVCAIVVSIRHETGTPKVWWRLNKPFFYELRRQMLGWRKVTPERVREYIDRMQGATVAQSGMVRA